MFYSVTLSKLDFDPYFGNHPEPQIKYITPLILPDPGNLPDLPPVFDNASFADSSKSKKQKKSSSSKKSRSSSKKQKKSRSRKRSRSRSRSRSRKPKKRGRKSNIDKLKMENERLNDLVSDEKQKRKEYQIKNSELRGKNRALEEQIKKLKREKNEAEEALYHDFDFKYFEALQENLRLKSENFAMRNEFI